MSTASLYLDTNVYTRLIESVPSRAHAAVRQRVLEDGAEVYLSPTNILEFIQTKDGLRRERLVLLAQELCAADLLVEVEGLITHQIACQLAREDVRRFLKPEGRSSSQLSRVWKDVRTNKNRTFVFSHDNLRQLDMVRNLFAVLHAHLRRGGAFTDLLAHIPSLVGKQGVEIARTLKHAAARRRLESVSATAVDPPVQDCILLMTLIVLCAGLTPFGEEIEDFWSVLGIQGAAERFEYCFSRLSFVFRTGPLVGLGAIMAGQALRKHNSGNVFDCYHAAYSSVVDTVFTNDKALLKIAQSFPKSPNLKRVHAAGEFFRRYV